MDPTNSSITDKKNALEELSKEELLKKCKHFLTIIQKAKQSKHTLEEEIATLKLTRSSEMPPAVEELLHDLTQQKLNFVSTIEDLKMKNESLVTNLNQYKEEKSRLDTELNMKDNENVSFKRQISRLSDENEQLILHLESQEKQIEELNKIGLDQRKQLLELEERNNQFNIQENEKIKELEKMLSISLNEIKKMKSEQNQTSCQEDCKHLQRNKLITEKLRNYHMKIVKMDVIVKTLHKDRIEILEDFKTYMNHVNDSKSKLKSAAEKFVVLINEYEEENENLRNSNQHLREQLEAHKTDDEKSKDIEKLEDLKMKNLKLTEELDNIKIVNIDLVNQLETLQRENDNYKLELEVSNSALEEMRNECDAQKLEIESLQHNNSLQKTQIAEMNMLIESLHREHDKALATEKQLAAKSGDEILKLVKENDTLTDKLVEIQVEIEKFKTEKILVNADIQTEDEFFPSEQAILLKNENSQLLTEMNEMNQELKERGENISRLESYCDEIKKKMQHLETENVNNATVLDEKNATIEVKIEEIHKLTLKLKEKEEEILGLKDDIESFKEKLNRNDAYSECDFMSTSTISRTEEMERLKDLEESWEEKYGKLKDLAIKLKAKLKEETATKNDIQAKLDNNNETIKNVQSDLSRVTEELKLAKKQVADREATLHSHTETLKNRDQLISQLKIEIDDLRKDKANIEQWKKQIALKVQVLRKELEEKESVNRESQSKISKLQQDLESKEQALKLEKENHRHTKNSLQHSTNENKKHTVLSLEMQDYEKSVKDLSQRLETKNEQLSKLKGQVESQKENIVTLSDQLKTMEDSLRERDLSIGTALDEIALYRKKITELDSALQIKEEETSNLEQQLESIRSQKEELSTELSRDIAERQKIINNLREDKESLYMQNLNLQQCNRNLQQRISLIEAELATVSNEYDNYKIRAQSVLRQNQSRDIGLEEKLNGNVSSLTCQVEGLNLEIDEMRTINQGLKKETDDLKAENSLLVLKFDEVSNELDQLKVQYKSLVEKHEQTVNEHKETVRSLKVHVETLGQCYRQQLSEQEVRHNREIIELQSKIEKAPSPTETILQSLPTMPREEGEGSESIDSVNNLPIPLEKLLGDEDDHTVNALKKQILEQESKLNHLTELLSDTEQDLVKHVQMNKLLKEEIRRHQRSLEREKHAENMEYLKNVVFKFVTLHNGDERSRLVPVLNTILKLSPEESRKLDSVAKGDPGAKAWSSYLPIWPSQDKS